VIARSSRCGPAPVDPRSRSRVSRPASSSSVSSDPNTRARRPRDQETWRPLRKAQQALRPLQAARQREQRQAQRGLPSRAQAPRETTVRRGHDGVLRCAARALGRSRPATLHVQGRSSRAFGRDRSADEGAPLTTTRRSGVNARTGNRRRSSSAPGTEAPFNVMRLTPAAVTVTCDWNLAVDAVVPSVRTRVAAAPKRTTRASRRVRGENPCVPTWIASSRLVLPAPFGPTIIVSPGLKLQLLASIGPKVLESEAP